MTSNDQAQQERLLQQQKLTQLAANLTHEKTIKAKLQAQLQGVESLFETVPVNELCLKTALEHIDQVQDIRVLVMQDKLRRKYGIWEWASTLLAFANTVALCVYHGYFGNDLDTHAVVTVAIIGLLVLNAGFLLPMVKKQKLSQIKLCADEFQKEYTRSVRQIDSQVRQSLQEKGDTSCHADYVHALLDACSNQQQKR